MAKVKAFSLVETLTGFILISVALLIGFGIYNNVLNSHQISLRVEADIFLEKELQRTIKQSSFVDKIIDNEYFNVEQKIFRDEKFPQLIQIQLSAKSEKGTSLRELKQWVAIEEE